MGGSTLSSWWRQRPVSGAGPSSSLRLSPLPTPLCQRLPLEVVGSSWQIHGLEMLWWGTRGRQLAPRGPELEPVTREVFSEEERDRSLANRHKHNDREC